MKKVTTPRNWIATVGGSLALAAGAAVADRPVATELHHRPMEIVEVVEELRPNPVTPELYFRPLAEAISAELDRHQSRTLTASVMTGFEQLSSELELAGGPRVAVVNERERPEESAVTVDPPLRPGVTCWRTCF